jgi:hypothetical protein
MLLFLENNVYSALPQTHFEICEDDIYGREINLNAYKDIATNEVFMDTRAKVILQKLKNQKA